MTNDQLVEKAETVYDELTKCYKQADEATKQYCLAYEDGVKGKKLKVLKNYMRAMRKSKNDCIKNLYDFFSPDVIAQEVNIYTNLSMEIVIVICSYCYVTREIFINAIKDHGFLRLIDFKII